MSISFLNLMTELFPNITKETSSKLYRLIRRKEYYLNWIFSRRHLDVLCQGDVIEKLSISFMSSDEKIIKKDTLAILINNTCEMQDEDRRNQFISIIPIYPFHEYIQHFKDIPNYQNDVKDNVITDKFFVGQIPGEDKEYIADLSLLSTISTEYLHNELEKGRKKKIASLSENGYYYFLAKLTLHLMRPESNDVTREPLVNKLK